MSGDLPVDPYVIVDVPLAEDQRDARIVLPVPVEYRHDFIGHFQAGIDVLDEDEDLEFPYRGSTVWIPRSSLVLAIEQLQKGA